MIFDNEWRKMTDELASESWVVFIFSSHCVLLRNESNPFVCSGGHRCWSRLFSTNLFQEQSKVSKQIYLLVSLPKVQFIEVNFTEQRGRNSPTWISPTKTSLTRTSPLIEPKSKPAFPKTWTCPIWHHFDFF